MTGGAHHIDTTHAWLGISSLYPHCHRRVNGRKGKQASVLLGGSVQSSEEWRTDALHRVQISYSNKKDKNKKNFPVN